MTARLNIQNLFLGPGGAGRHVQQGFQYDAFGNLTKITGAGARDTPTDPTSNRLVSGTYDTSGNLNVFGTGSTTVNYRFDPFNLMWLMSTGGEDWAYLYTADDERLESYEVGAVRTNCWTLRDLPGKVLREYRRVGEPPVWTVTGDYGYRDGRLFAAGTPTGS